MEYRNEEFHRKLFGHSFGQKRQQNLTKKAACGKPRRRLKFAMKIETRIKELRLEKELTQSDLAKAISTSQRNINFRQKCFKIVDIDKFVFYSAYKNTSKSCVRLLWINTENNIAEKKIR